MDSPLNAHMRIEHEPGPNQYRYAMKGEEPERVVRLIALVTLYFVHFLDADESTHEQKIMWRVEDVLSGKEDFVDPEHVGGQLSEMEVIAWSARC